MDDDGILGGVGDPSANIGQVGEPDPPIRLTIGARVLVNTADWFTDPLEIIAKGANAFDDRILLAQDSPNPDRSFASGARSPGLFQNDPAVNFVDDQVHHTIAFTVTPELANAMMDPADGLTPGYRCGNQLHRNSQRGDFIIVSGDAPDKSQQQLDGVGSSFDTAGTVALSATGSGSLSGGIQVEGNQDLYHFVATTSGRMTIASSPANGNALQGILFVYGNQQQTLAYDVAHAAGQPSTVQVDVVSGQSYFVQTSGYTDSTGAYQLNFATSFSPGPFPGAQIVPLNDIGVGSINGVVITPGQVSRYYFVAPVTGQMTIRQDATLGSALDSQLAVYDKTLTLLAANEHGDGGFNSRLQVNVVAGQPYLVQASGRVYVQDVNDGQVIDFALSTGGFELLFTTQDFGSTFDTAHVINLDPFDTGRQDGTIAAPVQQDLFRFTISTSSSVVVVLTTPAGQPLRGAVSVFDGSRNLVGSATDVGTGSSEVNFVATAGQTYYAEVTGSGGSLGGYALYVTEDDNANGDTFATAIPLDVSSGFALDYEATQDPGDHDWRSFTPSSSGQIVIRQYAVDGTVLDTSLAVFDATGTPLATSDDDGSSTNSQIVLNVTAGTTYYVRTGGVGDSTGHWQLTLSMDNTADSFNTATFLDLSSGSAVQSGYIGGAGDVDLFRFTAPASGPLPVALNALKNLFPEANEIDPTLIPILDGQLAVFDSSGNRIAQNANTIGGSNFLVAPVVQGNTYYIQVQGLSHSAGAYRLVVGKEHGSSMATASQFPLDDTGSGTLSSRLNFPTDQDWFHFRSSVSGPLAVVEALAPFSGLIGQISVYDTASPVPHLLGTASNDTTFHGPAEVLINTTAGQDYFVQVQALPIFPHGPVVPGAYNLIVSVPPANRTPDAALPLDLSTGTATAAGAVSFPGAGGWFKFQAPVTGMVGIEESNLPGTFLIDALSAFDASLNPVGGGPAFGFGQGFASLQLSVTAGQSYYVHAAGFGNFTGPFTVSVSVLPTSGPQLQPTDLHTVTAQDLVNSLLGANSGISVVPGSVSYTGAPQAAGTFSGGTGIVGFEKGVLLTTGSTTDVVGPNFTEGSPGLDNAQPGDPDLNGLVQGGTRNAAVLSFDFVPTVDVIQLQYVFASSEYTRFAASAFDDVFAAFVNGIDYARLPGTGSAAPGSGDLVSVNTVNAQSNPQFFIDNSIGPTGGLAPLHTQMNGLTTVLTLSAPVVPGEVNHIKLAIANAVDPHYPSAVFLQEDSLRAVTETVAASAGSQGLKTLVNQASAASNSGLSADEINQLINKAVVDGLIQDRNLLGDFLVIPVDPVDFTLTDPNGQKITQTQQGITRSAGDLRNPFYIRDGVNTLLILPNAVPGEYRMDLAGVGSGGFQLGANYVSAFGQVTSVLLNAAAAPLSTEVVLDFRNLDGRVEQMTLASAAAASTSQPPGTPSVPTLPAAGSSFDSALASAATAPAQRPSFLSQPFTAAVEFGTTLVLTLGISTTSVSSSAGAAGGGGGGDVGEDAALEPESDANANLPAPRKAKEAKPVEGTSDKGSVKDAATPSADHRPPADVPPATDPMPTPAAAEPEPDEISALDQLYSGDIVDLCSLPPEAGTGGPGRLDSAPLTERESPVLIALLSGLLLGVVREERERRS
jgi:hypothetical protein